MAELYGLVSVMQYDASKREHSLAMALGDEFDLDAVKSFALADFCTRCGLNRSDFARGLETLCSIAIQQAPLQAKEAIYLGKEREVVTQIMDFVIRRAMLLKSLAKEITKYKSDMF